MSEIGIEILETEVVKQNKRLLSLPNKISEKKLSEKSKNRRGKVKSEKEMRGR